MAYPYVVNVKVSKRHPDHKFALLMYCTNQNALIFDHNYRWHLNVSYFGYSLTKFEYSAKPTKRQIRKAKRLARIAHDNRDNDGIWDLD